MNTKTLMTATSLSLALAGILTLFIPQELLALLNLPITSIFTTLIQLIGALYFSLALMNWTAKENSIGGIYSRPISLGNFSHFFIGTLVLAKYQLSNEINGLIVAMLCVYAIFAVVFWWLVFRHTGIAAN